MSHLRLVGGTAVPKPKPVTRVAAKKHPFAGENISAVKQRAAREILGFLVSPGQTVQDLIDEANQIWVGKVNIDQGLRSLTISDLLLDIGVWLVLADEEQDLSVRMYATVIYPKKLIKAFPQMAKYSEVLPRLPVVN